MMGLVIELPTCVIKLSMRLSIGDVGACCCDEVSNARESPRSSFTVTYQDRGSIISRLSGQDTLRKIPINFLIVSIPSIALRLRVNSTSVDVGSTFHQEHLNRHPYDLGSSHSIYS